MASKTQIKITNLDNKPLEDISLSAKVFHAKTEAMCAARAMDANLTALAKTSSRARRALQGDGIMTGDNASAAASHPDWHPFGPNNCMGW